MNIVKRMYMRVKRAAAIRSAIHELSRLTNRDLSDIGISRSDIKYIARKTAYQQYNTMQFR